MVNTATSRTLIAWTARGNAGLYRRNKISTTHTLPTLLGLAQLTAMPSYTSGSLKISPRSIHINCACTSRGNAEIYRPITLIINAFYSNLLCVYNPRQCRAIQADHSHYHSYHSYHLYHSYHKSLIGAVSVLWAAAHQTWLFDYPLQTDTRSENICLIYTAGWLSAIKRLSGPCSESLSAWTEQFKHSSRTNFITRVKLHLTAPDLHITLQFTFTRCTLYRFHLHS